MVKIKINRLEMYATYEYESYLPESVIEKSELLFKKHVEKSIKITNVLDNFFENFNVSLEEADIDGSALRIINSNFFNKVVYNDLKRIYEKTFPNDTYNILKKDTKGNINLFKLHLEEINKDRIDGIEEFDNIRKLHYLFYLWLDKYGLMHFYDGSYYIIDLGHFDYHISNIGEIRLVKINNKECVLLTNYFLDGLLEDEKNLVKTKKQIRNLKTIILFISIAIVMFILNIIGR